MDKFIVGLMAIALLSCAQKGNETTEATDTIQSSGSELSAATKDLYSDGRSKMIKTAECRFQVSDMKKSKEAIIMSIKKHLAYIESSNLEFQNPMLEEQLTIRVLNDYFENLLDEIASQASYMNYKKINVNDVSKEFVDLESRLKTKREVQQRYEEILRKKTGTIEELLNTEKQIGELQEEIEAAVGQMNFLKEKVRYSTIKLEVYQIAEQQITEAKTDTGLTQKFSNAFISGLAGVTSILVAATYLWPFIIIGLAGWVIWTKRKRMIKTS